VYVPQHWWKDHAVYGWTWNTGTVASVNTINIAKLDYLTLQLYMVIHWKLHCSTQFYVKFRATCTFSLVTWSSMYEADSSVALQDFKSMKQFWELRLLLNERFNIIYNYVQCSWFLILSLHLINEMLFWVIVLCPLITATSFHLMNYLVSMIGSLLYLFIIKLVQLTDNVHVFNILGSLFFSSAV